MPPVLALPLALALDGYGTGAEWMVYASVIVPVLLLIGIWIAGSKRTV